MNIPTIISLLISAVIAQDGFFMPSEEQFAKAVACFKGEDGKEAPKPSKEAYDEFRKYASGNMLAVEQAMFLTHIVYGTMGLQFVEEIACKGVNEENDKCPNGKYHGRGYIMLSTKENYGQFSKDIFGSEKVLLDHPELLLEPKEGTRSAYWFWNRHVRPAIMAEEALTKSAFGVTVRAINGVNECPVDGKPPKNADGAKKRLDLYKCVKESLGVPGPDATLEGCM